MSGRRDGLSIVGLGAAACVACCAGPLLAFLGGLTIAGTVSTVFVGAAGLLVAAAGATAFIVVRSRSTPSSREPAGPVAVAIAVQRRRGGLEPTRDTTGTQPGPNLTSGLPAGTRGPVC